MDSESQPDDANDYLNQELFHSIIATHIVATPFTITKLQHASPLGVGENFLTKILKINVTIRLDADGTRQDHSFIAKIVGSLFVDEKSINDMKVFPKEMEMYQKIVPALEAIWKDVADIDVIFGPKLYYAEMEPHKILIFEDLTSSNYKMLGRLDGFNEQQVLLALEKLAKWHAASKVYVDRCETMNPIFLSGMFHSGFVEFLGGYYTLLYQSLMECLSDCDDVAEEHLKSMKSWEGKIIPNLTKITTYDPNDFNVLNHGDLWINNLMMVTNEAGVSTDVKFIDYQLSVYASPIIDLLYFLPMSVHHKLYTAQFDEFIAYYHKQLVISLQLLNYNKSSIPTLKDISMDLLKKSFFNSMMIVEGVSTILIDYKTDDVDINSIGLDNECGREARRKMHSNPRALEAVKGLIKFYGNRGMLEL